MQPREPASASQLRLITRLPGWQSEVYASNSVPKGIEGWRRVARKTTVAENQRIPLDTEGRRFRYYLIWIVGLGPNDKASISELTLQERRPAQKR